MSGIVWKLRELLAEGSIVVVTPAPWAPATGELAARSVIQWDGDVVQTVAGRALFDAGLLERHASAVAAEVVLVRRWGWFLRWFRAFGALPLGLGVYGVLEKGGIHGIEAGSLAWLAAGSVFIAGGHLLGPLLRCALGHAWKR